MSVPFHCMQYRGNRCVLQLWVKECLGWHSEWCTRNVPTLRISAPHRTARVAPRRRQAIGKRRTGKERPPFMIRIVFPPSRPLCIDYGISFRCIAQIGLLGVLAHCPDSRRWYRRPFVYYVRIVSEHRLPRAARFLVVSCIACRFSFSLRSSIVSGLNPALAHRIL